MDINVLVAKTALEVKRRRVACFPAKRLSADIWLHIWQLSAIPHYRVGTVLIEDEIPLCIIAGGLEQLSITFDMRPLSVGVVFELILRNDAARLQRLGMSALTDVPHALTVKGVTAFNYAAALGVVDCLSVLIDRFGVQSPLLVGADGMFNSHVLNCCSTRFPFGCRQGVLNLLLQRFGGKFKSADLTALLEQACFDGASWMIEYLDSNFGSKLELGTSLISAARGGHIECVRTMLDHGADVNQTDEEGLTALMGASSCGHTDIARLLLEHGADPNIRDSMGWTALTEATRRNRAKMVQLLEEYGARDMSGGDDFRFLDDDIYDDESFGYGSFY